MDIYKILKRALGVRNGRVRLALLLAAHVARRRLIGVYVDPVMACNLRCQMCAFSSRENSHRTATRMTDEELQRMADGLCSRALKLQIGCGAEPTLDKRVAYIIRAGKAKGVPYVALTTNGQLLSPQLLREYADAGLDEVTLSLHGTTRATYEWLMQRASFDKFRAAIDAIRKAKDCYPNLRLRINYTVNADNVAELKDLFKVVDPKLVDVLQVRPVQCLGDTAYKNFSLEAVKEAYDEVLLGLARVCGEHGITCLIPDRKELDEVAADRDSCSELFESITYCYVGPQCSYAADYDSASDSYASYHRRRHTARRLLMQIFSFGSSGKSKNNFTKKLNYHVKS